MKSFCPHALYALLFVYIAVSLTYQIVGSVSFLVGYFDLRHQVQNPFEIDYGSTVTTVTGPAKQAGLAVGDTVESLNGVPYRGRSLWQSTRWYAHPGDQMRVGVRRVNGTRTSVSVPLTGVSEKPHLADAVFLIFLTIVVPLFCLFLGYWVALARPQDPNAWFILVLLSFPGAFISVSTQNWWPGIWLSLRLVWHIVLEILAIAALLWLGLLFPERSRIDVRFPWLKWMITILLAFGLAIELTTDYSDWYDQALLPNRSAIEAINDKVQNWVGVLCLVLYWIAIFDKLRTASSPDARRRLRVLCAGSLLGLGSILLIWGGLPWLGVNPASIQWLGYLSAALFLFFPLTLAYVVVVQRAMDVRILLRLGTKYVLARATLVILQFAIAAVIVIEFLLPLINRKQHQAVNLIVSLALVGILLRSFVARDSLRNRLQRWLDRKFFREACNAELVLSELSEQVRSFTEKAPLVETVMRRISEVLHVDQIVVLLRGSDVFQLQQAIGVPMSGPLLLRESSSAVQNLTRTNRPATLYRENPDEWFLQADEEEKRTLNNLRAELLLALPGRKHLMGVMGLGPKRSEEPYTPSDLRLLQSVGIQTGLALEISELAHSLANEAAQRERIQREIEIAREVQQRLFPQEIPAIKGLSLAGACRPAQGVGGDYYDVFELDDGRLALAIGDVSGKGISAALLMASLRASLRGMTLEGPADLARILQKVNRLVYEASASNRYATFFFATYNPKTWELRYVNAGHNPPILVHGAPNGPLRIKRLEAGGLVVGLMRDVSYAEESVTLEAGSLLLTYTDGISEAMTAEDEEWGEERMLDAATKVRDRAAADILAAVFGAADEFTAGAPQHDDMTLLVLKVESTGASVSN